MEHCRRAGQWGHRSGAQYSDCAEAECFLSRYLKGARWCTGPCSLSCWKDVFLTSPAWPTPASKLSCLSSSGICLLPAQRGPRPSTESSVLVVDLASPLVTRPYGYSFFIHSGIYQDSRASVFLTLALVYCFSAFSCPLSLLSFSLLVSQQALLVV